MVALEYIGDNASSIEGHHFIVRDRNGLTILEGTIHNSRLARVKNDIQKTDLSQWTIVEAAD